VQKGVIVPKMAARILTPYLFLWESMPFIFSAGMNERKNETAKIITARSKNIFTVSKMKKFTASAKRVCRGIENTR
jgi:hypothetical protein